MVASIMVFEIDRLCSPWGIDSVTGRDRLRRRRPEERKLGSNPRPPVASAAESSDRECGRRKRR
jgi:hypothetical protein